MDNFYKVEINEDFAQGFSKLRPLIEWCKENIGEEKVEWYFDYDFDLDKIEIFCFRFYFKNINDALIFKITWI
jgi:hypothetical protein